MTVTATISRSALAHNLNIVRKQCSQSQVLAMVKADAYGHGLLGATDAMSDADAFGVARLEEALRLRAHKHDARIVIMSEVANTETLEKCAEQQLDICLHDQAGVDTLRSATLPRALNIWLKLDTGMHRLGIHQAEQAIHTLTQHANCQSLVVLSHFASADCDPAQTQEQTACFDQAIAGLECPQSLANSAAILHYPSTHRDWVRPGIMLYGANPKGISPLNELRTAMRLEAPILAVRKIAAGERVGYGATWKATKNSDIATVGIGYGDGYSRHAQAGTPVFIDGHACPLIGRVSMDMITVDISEHPKKAHISAGMPAQLWGCDNPVERVAEHCETISYTLLTGISQRVKVIYEE